MVSKWLASWVAAARVKTWPERWLWRRRPVGVRQVGLVWVWGVHGVDVRIDL